MSHERDGKMSRLGHSGIRNGTHRSSLCERNQTAHLTILSESETGEAKGKGKE
jgi:hypothetical protein